MRNFHTAVVPDFPAGIFDAFGPVQILAIHEEGFVQKTNIAYGLTAHKHDSADY